MPSSHTSTVEEPDFIAVSQSMQELCRQVTRMADTDATVLLNSESGTGKEIISKMIHCRSRRSNKPFVALNCGAISSSIIESELFGHEKGAFTGAHKQKKGCFELADKGTLFLDEIGEMPQEMQVKLLRAVEQKSFRRLGGDKEVEVDVRIVAATNRDMDLAVASGEFRRDLYYRLSVIELNILPLRKRKEDIPALIEYFMNLFSDKYSCSDKRLSEHSVRLLLDYSWPGNVRELRNVIERCVIMCPEDLITPDHLTHRLFGVADLGNAGNEGAAVDSPAEPHMNGNGYSPASADEESDQLPNESPKETANEPPRVQIPVGATIQEAERMLIDKTLSMVDNNKSEAARILGFSRQTLHNKLNEYTDRQNAATVFSGA